ncbi:arylamine N-acetyltransferase [Intestinibacter bartlettii]|uniref:arylamine N-acetyltransferase n=1 Tax=Intestinibacter bartlettii TaxID=261299 RepID=UPI0029031EC0|nr:arylamine N-acetyltransferase [Intestinibacter bartlettii]MDU2163761.1 arylamine N-acetyltransferase [Intestinibacter bartlettii]
MFDFEFILSKSHKQRRYIFESKLNLKLDNFFLISNIFGFGLFIKSLKTDIDDKSYISDVGVLSELSRKSLELEAGKVQNDGKCDYKFEYNPKQEGEYILYQRKPKKDWKQIYSFSLEPQLDIDYVLPSFYCESHPNSPFINSMKVARYTEDEHIRFFDGELIFYKDGQVIKIEKVREDKIDDVLKEYFNIVIDNFVKVLV